MLHIQHTRGVNTESFVDSMRASTAALASATDALAEVVGGPDHDLCIEMDRMRKRLHIIRVRGSRLED